MFKNLPIVLCYACCSPFMLHIKFMPDNFHGLLTYLHFMGVSEVQVINPYCKDSRTISCLIVLLELLTVLLEYINLFTK